MNGFHVPARGPGVVAAYLPDGRSLVVAEYSVIHRVMLSAREKPNE